MDDAPRGRLENTIAQLWKETFHLEHVGRNANFFELGGDSVTGTELMDKVSSRLGVALPVVMLFQNPSPREMAQYISSLDEPGLADPSPYDGFRKLREQQSAGDDIEFLLALPNAQAPQLLQNLTKSRAQWRQDLFVLAELGFKRNGFFVEFGATNGLDLSNTWLLEKEFEWTGILAEPARCWHEALAANRSAVIEKKCVWSESGVRLSFNEVEIGELSTLSSLSEGDYHAETRKTGKVYEVETISLNDLLERHQAPRHIDYLSIDTEGSELEILSALDFARYDIQVITCEHNFMPAREDIHALLARKGYVRKYREISKVDDWYVKTHG